jgi:hypothetical protein
LRFNSSLEAALYDWVSGQLPTATVIWDKQEAPKPAKPFATLNIIAPTLEESSTVNWTATDTFTHTFKKLFTLSVNIYANDNYLGLMDTLKQSAQLGSVREIFFSEGLSWRSTSETQDLTELLDTSFEPRCQCDFVFGYSEKLDDTILEIHRVSGSGLGTSFDVNIN